MWRERVRRWKGKSEFVGYIVESGSMIDGGGGRRHGLSKIDMRSSSIIYIKFKFKIK